MIVGAEFDRHGSVGLGVVLFGSDMGKSSNRRLVKD